MKAIVRFFENSKRAINESQRSERKISWAVINNSIEKQLLELSQMKFKDPKIPKEEMQKYFTNLNEEIDNEFRRLLLGWSLI